MDITNDTDTNTKYTVKNSSGSGAGPHKDPVFRPEDTVNWKELAAGSTVHHKPASKGPWKVYFYVAGQSLAAEASSDNDHVQLVTHAGNFRAQKVAHARV
jgi:hypothetical protein